MEKLEQTGNQFSNFPCARYATDVTFETSNMPSGTQVEQNQFYSAKHKLHGYKVEVYVLPNGFAINCTKHFRGIKSDISIFRDNIEFHQVQLHKLPTEPIISANGPLASDRPDEWAVLTAKGYRGLSAVIRSIHPEKTKPGKHLSRDSVARNHRISSDLIIVENFFGRLVSLWSICANKFRWKEDMYETIFKPCVSLTNLRIRSRLLRPQEETDYRNYIDRIRSIVSIKKKRRAEIQKSRHR